MLVWYWKFCPLRRNSLRMHRHGVMGRISSHIQQIKCASHYKNRTRTRGALIRGSGWLRKAHERVPRVHRKVGLEWFFAHTGKKEVQADAYCANCSYWTVFSDWESKQLLKALLCSCSRRKQWQLARSPLLLLVPVRVIDFILALSSRSVHRTTAGHLIIKGQVNSDWTDSERSKRDLSCKLDH